MQCKKLAIPEVLLLTPRVFGDARGFFFESFNARFFAEASGYSGEFVQDNHSRLARGVLCGLHYQLPPLGAGQAGARGAGRGLRCRR